MTNENTAAAEVADQEEVPDFARRIQHVHDALRHLEEGTDGEDDLPELFADFLIKRTGVLAMILMQNLPHDAKSFDKAYWLTIAQEMGPDWIRTFRSVGAFMERVDGFNISAHTPT